MSKKASTSIRSVVSGAVFLACLALILIDAALYLVGSRSVGFMFVIGMTGICLIALCSGLFEKRKGRIEDVITMLIGALFFGWLAWKAIQ